MSGKFGLVRVFSTTLFALFTVQGPQMINIRNIETPAQAQPLHPVAELPLEMLALVGGGDGAVVPF
jgi:hypothetical protein